MKKKVLFVASIFLATATFAQDGLTSKKGEAYLPEAGDWSIGFDAGSLTGYFGNMFNGASANSLNAGGWMNGTVGQELRGKMFKDESTAYRVRARIGFGSNSSEVVGKYDDDADAATQDVDYAVKTSVSNGFNLVLGAGLEKRRGNTRVQGYYGGEVVFGLLGGTTTTTDDNRALTDNYNLSGATRNTEVANGSTLSFGVNGFIGVEYFFAPKVSLGAEYTWGLNFATTGEGETSTERWGTAFGAAAGTANSLQTETVAGPGSAGSFGLDTGGQFALNVQFHF